MADTQPDLINDTSLNSPLAQQCRIENPSTAGMSFDLVALGTQSFGVAHEPVFLSGREHRIDIWFHPQAETRLKLEVQRHVTRMTKAYLEFDGQGGLLTVGDELLSAEVQRAPTGELHVMIRFIPQHSRVGQVLLLALADDAPASERRMSFGRIELRRAAERRFDRLHETPYVYDFDGTLFHLSGVKVLGNYLELGFELMRPGRTLAGLSLSSPAALEAVQWFTNQASVAADGAADLPGMLLTRRQTDHGIASPALLERFGRDFAQLGHRITALYRDFQDFAHVDLAQSDALLQQLQLHAVFDDGSRLDIPLSSIDKVAVHAGHELVAILNHTATIPPGRRGLLLEIGARGAASVASRAFFTQMYDYIGLDRWEGSNVDIAADAHAMSAVIEAGSVDIIYSHSVMEHLLSPIQCVIEANKVLRVGGLFTALVPCTWPLHAEPWDFWRMSAHAWRGLLNQLTGFEIISTSEAGWASVVPHYGLPSGLSRMHLEAAPHYTGVVARKTRTVEGVTAPWSPDLAVGRYDH